MIARSRGEHDRRWGQTRPLAVRELAAPGSVALPRQPNRELGGGRRRGRRFRLMVLGMAGGLVLAGWALARFSSGTAPARLPATPRAWLDAYEAAAVDNPGRVCSELFAPQLARAYSRSVHASCRGYFRQITSFSVVVHRELEDGPTAVLELHQTVRPREWAVVLSRHGRGWRAIDLVTGQTVR